MSYRHIPVMPDEAIRLLNCRPGKIFVDCTIGGCGHASAIVDRILPGGRLIGIDQDRDAVAAARVRLAPFLDQVELVHDNFMNLPHILGGMGIKTVDGILADLGLSFHQIEDSGRGFSFRKDEPLDMRMDIRSDITAGTIVNTADERRLEALFREYGEERGARRIARAVVRRRESGPIETSGELADIIATASGRPRRAQRIHPATRTFMALRIAVNRELEALETFLEQATDLLNPGGRLCVISFHSGEDRPVKRKMRELAMGCDCPANFPKCVCGRTPQVRLLTRKAIRPDADEIERNPMARSARLRAMEKLGQESHK